MTCCCRPARPRRLVGIDVDGDEIVDAIVPELEEVGFVAFDEIGEEQAAAELVRATLDEWEEGEE